MPSTVTIPRGMSPIPFSLEALARMGQFIRDKGTGPKSAQGPSPQQEAMTPSVPPMGAPMPPTQMQSAHEPGAMIGAGSGFDMAMLSPIQRPDQLTQPLPSLAPDARATMGAPTNTNLRLGEVFQMPDPNLRLEDIFQSPLQGPMPDLGAIRRSRMGLDPSTVPDIGGIGLNELMPQSITSMPSLQPDDVQSMTLDFGEGPQSFYDRRADGNFLRDQLENDLILNDRRSGYAGAEGQRARDAKASAQSGLLDLDRNAAKAAGGGADGLTYEQRMALKTAEPPGVGIRANTNADLAQQRIDQAAEKARIQSEVAQGKLTREDIGLRMQNTSEQEKAAKWVVENSDDELEVNRANSELSRLKGKRRMYEDVLDEMPALATKPTKPGAKPTSKGKPTPTAKPAAPTAPSGEPADEDFARAEAEVLAENPDLAADKDALMDAVLDRLGIGMEMQ